jgi:transcription-repair coupling factor (superfamily II helicase)
MYQSNSYQYLEELKTDKLLICKDDKEALQIRDVANLLAYDTFVLPDIRVSVGEDLRSYGEDIQELFTQLSSYHTSKKKKILISPLRTLLIPFPKPELFAKKSIEFGDTLNLKELKDTLYQWGYHFVDIAAQKGEVSFRGDIIDIYPIHVDKPYRISLFDEEVETIQYYDEGTQKRVPEELESLEITPAF